MRKLLSALLLFAVAFLGVPISKAYADNSCKVTSPPNTDKSAKTITIGIDMTKGGIYDTSLVANKEATIVISTAFAIDSTRYQTSATANTDADGLVTFTADISNIVPGSYTFGAHVEQQAAPCLGNTVTIENVGQGGISGQTGGSATLTFDPASPKVNQNITATVTNLPADARYFINIDGVVSCASSSNKQLIFPIGATAEGSIEVTVMKAFDQSPTGSCTGDAPVVAQGSISVGTFPTPTNYPNFNSDPCPNKKCSFGSLKLDTSDPAKFITGVFGIILSMAGGIAVVLIMISGYQMVASQGNPEKVQAAREGLTAAITGLLFVIFSLVLLNVIGYSILHIPGFNK